MSHPFPSPLLHTAFDERVRKTPTAIALQEGEESITFSELLHRAERFATGLAARGVGSGPRGGVGDGRREVVPLDQPSQAIDHPDEQLAAQAIDFNGLA